MPALVNDAREIRAVLGYRLMSPACGWGAGGSASGSPSGITL
jgi:hypothetical protein